jgi:uncharacterized membrane protein
VGDVDAHHQRFVFRMLIYYIYVDSYTHAHIGTYYRPFYEYPNMKLDFQIIIQVARKGKRPTMPDTTPAALKDLVTRYVFLLLLLLLLLLIVCVLLTLCLQSKLLG